ncbi:hypothetical protein KRR26_29690, partial [Corallococcus sp. M34]|nr:hypothetical protein [Citreicoccus inhibens]
MARSALGYESQKAQRENPVVERMRELALQYPRYVYRRIRIFLGRDGHPMCPDKAYRLWKQEGRTRPDLGVEELSESGHLHAFKGRDGGANDETNWSRRVAATGV